MQILTWNTQWCCGVDGTVDPQRLIDTARSFANFDVLCLQEIAVHYPQLQGNAGHPDLLAEISALLPGYQVFFGPSIDTFDAQGQRQQFGNLIATRLPVLQVAHHPLPYPADMGVRSMPRMASIVTVKDPVLGAVRIITTHLEFYSATQRMAQTQALLALHQQACAQALHPPEPRHDGSPYQTRTHTPHAVLCGDFNFEPDSLEYASLKATPAAGMPAGSQWWDAWDLLHNGAPHTPTFKVHDNRYGPTPVACDFFWVSSTLKTHVRNLRVQSQTQASDHQPLALHIG